MLNGVYFHIPFCLNKCNYCDFLSFKSSPEERDKYVEALIKELQLYPSFSYETVYFGGGTPSLLEPNQLENILSKLNFSENSEVTIEVNPKTVNLKKLKQFKQIGINRVSIGIQSFNSKNLKTLGRLHSSEEGIEVYNMAREVGFDNISLDLMFSLPEQTIEELQSDLDILFSLKPEHFSIYSLIWEEGTEFFKKLEAGELKETDNELEAQMFELIMDEAKNNGYVHYEISNFCLPDKMAKHNTMYWRNKEYLGIGLGASGYYESDRYKNYLNFSTYYDKILFGEKPIFEKEYVTIEEKEIYEYILRLRIITEGIVPKGKYIKICDSLTSKGFLVKNNQTYTLSRKGILMANDVFSEFL